MVTIPSGSFFFPQYIANKIATNTISDEEVSFGIENQIEEAIEYRFLSVDDESNEWFYLAKILGKTDKDTAFKLATIYHIEGDITQATQWYKQASELEHKKALTELIDLYIEEGHLLAAKKLLLPLKSKQDALHKLVDISVTLGDEILLNELIVLLKQTNNKDLINQLKRYGIIDDNSFYPTHSKIRVRGECRNSIQLLATNLSNLHKLDMLVENIKDHPLTNFICFNTPRYISSTQLNCEYEQDSAIKCDEALWASFIPEIDARYLGLMLNEGGANVDNGILYLDSNDDTQVFIHELSHLLGFVDEYPLSAKHKVCQKPQESKFSHNIAVLKTHYEGDKKDVVALLEKQIPWFGFIDKATPIIHKDGGKWVIGTPNFYLSNKSKLIGLFKSETCDKNKVQAFMPTASKTNLRYYEERFITLYTDLLKKNPDEFLMPSYHYNVAKTLFKNNKESLGLEWLNKALKRELAKDANLNNSEHTNREIRYNKIKNGEY